VVMIIQYPHILKFDIVTGSVEEIDENGDTVIVPGATTTIEVKCRFEPNADGERIISADGEQLDFGWIVYMPLDQPDITSGTMITGFNGADLIAQGAVERFIKGQLNARAWV
jgi:hypothetical protein